MRVAGFFLLLSGWGIVIAAIAMLGLSSAQAAFMLAGIAVQSLGLAFLFRSHLIDRGDES